MWGNDYLKFYIFDGHVVSFKGSILPGSGGSKSKVSKNGAKVPYFEADLGVGSGFGPLRRQKRLKSQKKNSPQNRDFAGLMMGPKKFGFWPF